MHFFFFLFFRNVTTRVVLQLVFGLVVVLPRAITGRDSGKTRANETATPDIPRAQQTPLARVASRKRLRMSGVEKLVQTSESWAAQRSTGRKGERLHFTVYAVTLCFICYKDKRSAGSWRWWSQINIYHHTETKLNPRFKLHLHLTSPNWQSPQLRRRNQYWHLPQKD